MPGIAYVNGRYLPLATASVNIQDRGYQLGDSIYEVVYVYRGRFIDRDLHLARLTRSLAAIGLPNPVAPSALPVIIAELLRRNRVRTGLVYIQVTRGVAQRDHPFPSPAPKPALVITIRPKPEPPRDAASWAVSAITLPDERWGHCDIKSTNLLPNVLARQAAKLAGAYEAILYNATGEVTEGAATNVWAVTADGVLRTRALDQHILPGCTRAALIEELAVRGTDFVESPIQLEELRAAREIFLTSAASFVKPVVMLDGKIVANGQPGPVTSRLLDLYLHRVRQN
jgi:D-alanine transaminase